MARCHRIGQTSDVKVYRFAVKDSIDERIVQVAQSKHGLDQAILGHLSSNGQGYDQQMLSKLIKEGAKAFFEKEKTGKVVETWFDRKCSILLSLNTFIEAVCFYY